MKKILTGFILAATLGYGGLVFADRVSVPSVSTLQSATAVLVDFLGLSISDAGAISGTTITATSTSATSSIAYHLQVGTTTATAVTQMQIANPRANFATNATTTITLGDPTASSTSRSGITMQSSQGSTTCVYVAGTSAPTLVVIAGACVGGN